MKSLAVLGTLFFPGTFVAVSGSLQLFIGEGMMTSCVRRHYFL